MTQNYPVKARPLLPPFSASTVTAASGFIKLVYNWYKYRFISFIDILSFGHHNLVLRLSDYSIRACLKLILLLSLVKSQQGHIYFSSHKYIKFSLRWEPAMSPPQWFAHAEWILQNPRLTKFSPSSYAIVSPGLYPSSNDAHWRKLMLCPLCLGLVHHELAVKFYYQIWAPVDSGFNCFLLQRPPLPTIKASRGTM